MVPVDRIELVCPRGIGRLSCQVHHYHNVGARGEAVPARGGLRQNRQQARRKDRLQNTESSRVWGDRVPMRIGRLLQVNLEARMLVRDAEIVTGWQ